MSCVRELLWAATEKRLRELAWRRSLYGMTGDDVVVVAVDVDDPCWTELAEILMPCFAWQAVRDRGERPIAKGAFLRDGLVDYLRAVAPEVGEAMRQAPQAGHYHAVVFADGGASLHVIAPVEEPS